MRVSKRVLRPLAGSAAFLALGTAAAWACTPQTVISQLRPLSGPAGTALTISGSTPTPVEIRWESAEGPVLASVQGRDFSAFATIPADAAPGVYYLTSNGRAIETFEVTGAIQHTQGTVEGDLWSGLAESARTGDIAGQPRESSQEALLRAGGLSLLAFGSFAAVLLLAIGKKRTSAR